MMKRAITMRGRSIVRGMVRDGISIQDIEALNSIMYRIRTDADFDRMSDREFIDWIVENVWSQLRVSDPATVLLESIIERMERIISHDGVGGEQPGSG